MEAADALRILLDADVSSRALVRILTGRGYDVVAAGLVEELKQLDDPILFAVAQEQRRLVLTHNTHDFPDILREWADAGRRHHGCIISAVPTNAYREMEQRLERWFRLCPSPDDWIDRAVFL
jgi:hypothetical protein